jgi:hypothetical protein
LLTWFELRSSASETLLVEALRASASWLAVALRTFDTEPPVEVRTSWIAAELEPTDSSMVLRAVIRRRSVSVTVSVIACAKVRMRPSISSARPVKLAARASIAVRRSSSRCSEKLLAVLRLPAALSMV